MTYYEGSEYSRSERVRSFWSAVACLVLGITPTHAYFRKPLRDMILFDMFSNDLLEHLSHNYLVFRPSWLAFSLIGGFNVFFRVNGDNMRKRFFFGYSSVHCYAWSC